MTTYDASTAQCHVFTYKDGLMSAIAHDLKLVVSDWSLSVDPDAGTCSGRFSASSLKVVCAMKDGAPSTSSKGLDTAKIEKNISKDVLNVRKHPEVTFQATTMTAAGDPKRYTVGGNLTINGVTRPISATISLDTTLGQYTTTVQISQPDFGIKPYSAMLGALKIRPEVRVVLSVPAPKAGA